MDTISVGVPLIEFHEIPSRCPEDQTNNIPPELSSFKKTLQVMEEENEAEKADGQPIDQLKRLDDLRVAFEAMQALNKPTPKSHPHIITRCVYQLAKSVHLLIRA